jgi:hypothetical protein
MKSAVGYFGKWVGTVCIVLLLLVVLSKTRDSQDKGAMKRVPLPRPVLRQTCTSLGTRKHDLKL